MLPSADSSDLIASSNSFTPYQDATLALAHFGMPAVCSHMVMVQLPLAGESANCPTPRRRFEEERGEHPEDRGEHRRDSR